MVIFDSARLYSLAPAAETQQGRVGLIRTVDERRQSGLLVALENPEVDHADARGPRRSRPSSGQMAAGGAPDEQDGHQHGRQHQGRPEVGLLVDQGERDGGQDQHDQRGPGASSRPLAAAQ